MEFQTQQDYEVAAKVYGSWQLLGEELPNTWNVKFSREFDMSNHRRLFSNDVKGWPLYEGRMVDQFDHRVAYWVSGRGRTAVWQYSSAPKRFSRDYPWRAQYYISTQAAIERQEQLYKSPKWRIGVCLVTAPTNRRTVIASMLPMACGVGHSIGTITLTSCEGDPSMLLYCLSVVNSFALDYVLRFRIKLNLGLYMLSESPVPRLAARSSYFRAIVPRAAHLTCTTPDFAELWQEVMGEEWDESKGATDPAERQTLRDELDALVAHLYRLSRDDFAHILGTFPLVFPDGDAGEAKKEALLAVYNRFAEGARGWERQCSGLDPGH